jgi:hypothetical protein
MILRQLVGYEAAFETADAQHEIEFKFGPGCPVTVVPAARVA